MNLNTVFFVFAFVCVSIAAVSCEDSGEEEETFKIPHNKYRRVLDAIRIILWGSKPEDGLAENKDLFVNTNVGVLNSMDSLIEMVNVDEILRIFFQTIIIVIAQNRYDLMPEDFDTRHPEFIEFMSGIGKVLDAMKSKGTESITIADLKPIMKLVADDKFWAAFDHLHDEIKEMIALEKSKNKSKDEL